MAIGLALLHLVIAGVVMQPAPYIGGDNAAYLSLARALLERGEYVDLWDPALPPHTQYPPLFPAVLAVALRLGVSGWIGLKWVTVACSAVAVGASYLWMRRATTPRIALAAGVLLAVLPGPLILAHQVLSDVPFWALAMLALWAAARADEKPDAATGWAVSVALLAAAAYLTRSAGLPLVVALAGAMALRRRFRALAVLAAGTGIPAVLWWLRGRSVGAAGYTSYLWYLDPYRPSLGTIGPAGWAERVGKNLANYFGEHVPVVLGGATTWRVALGAALVAAALTGWARRLPRPGAAELFLPLYGGLLLIWPAAWSGERFLLPLLPLLLAYAGEALRDGARALRLPPVAVGAVAVAALAAAALPSTYMLARRGAECTALYRDGYPFPCLPPVWNDLFATALRVRGQLPPGAVVLSRKPTLFFAISGYRSRVYPASADPADFFRVVREAGAGWVVVDQVPDLAPEFLHPVLLARRDDFCVVPELSLPNAVLLRIQPGGPPRAPGAPENAFRSCPLQ